VTAPLFGVKGSYDYTRLKGQEATTSTTIVTNTEHSFQSLRWLALATGRIGYTVFPDFLLYADAGAAWSKSNRNSFILSPFGIKLSTGFGHETMSGWTVGAGAEYRILKNVSVVVEYNYVDFTNQPIQTAASFVGMSLPSVNTVQLHLAKLGINYRF
jgi:outer membrane immunogenic protein